MEQKSKHDFAQPRVFTDSRRLALVLLLLPGTYYPPFRAISKAMSAVILLKAVAADAPGRAHHFELASRENFRSRTVKAFVVGPARLCPNYRALGAR